MELEARYIPVPLKLEPRESVNSERDVRFSSHMTKTPSRSRCSSSPASQRRRDSWRGSRRYVFFFSSSLPAHATDLGKSDPFVVFTLDGQRVFKSQTKKKTVNPEWNETFAVTIVIVIPGDQGPLY